MAIVSMIIIGNSCKEVMSSPPILTTSTLSDIAITTALGGGTITSNGSSEVTQRGVCWNSNTTPTIADNKTIDGSGKGNFISNITGLKPNTEYHLRAYATNSVGTGYGHEVVLVTYGLEDISGNRYHYLTIGTQLWMKENLKVTKYRDGSDIPNVTKASDWVILSTGAYCNFNNDAQNVGIYGRVYNWFAVADPRNVCPVGWHVPSIDEWDILTNSLGGATIAGGKMKSTGTFQGGDGLWYSPNTGATNSSGFTGLPGGGRGDVSEFNDIHSYANWWASDMGQFIHLQDTHTDIEISGNYSTNGKYVRCVKD